MRMEDSEVEECSFSDLSVEKMALTGCSLASSIFKGTPLQNISLCGSDISGIFISSDCKELRGAKLDIGQALDAARLMGIEVTV